MKIRSSLIFVSLILLVSCSKVNIENENNDMMSRLREKKRKYRKTQSRKRRNDRFRGSYRSSFEK